MDIIVEPANIFVSNPMGEILYPLEDILDKETVSLSDNLNGQWELSFNTVKRKDTDDPAYEALEEGMYLYLAASNLEDSALFKMRQPTVHIDAATESKSIRAYSCEVELEDKTVTFPINMGLKTSLEYLVNEGKQGLPYEWHADPDDATSATSVDIELLCEPYRVVPYDWIVLYNTYEWQLRIFLNWYRNLQQEAQDAGDQPTGDELVGFHWNADDEATAWIDAKGAITLRTDDPEYEYCKSVLNQIPRLSNRAEDTNPEHHYQGIEDVVTVEDLADIQTVDYRYIQYVTYTRAADDTITAVTLGNIIDDGGAILETFERRIIMLIGFYQTYGKKLSFLDILCEQTDYLWVPGEIYGLDQEESDFTLANSKMNIDANETIYSLLTSSYAQWSKNLVTFDRLRRKINVTPVDEVGEDTGIVFAYDNLLNSLDISTDEDTLATRLTIRGGEDLSIEQVNFGEDQVVDIDYKLNARDKYGNRLYVSDAIAEKYQRYAEQREKYRVGGDAIQFTVHDLVQQTEDTSYNSVTACVDYLIAQNLEDAANRQSVIDSLAQCIADEQPSYADADSRYSIDLATHHIDGYMTLTRERNRINQELHTLKERLPADSFHEDWDSYTHKELNEAFQSYMNRLHSLEQMYAEDYGYASTEDTDPWAKIHDGLNYPIPEWYPEGPVNEVELIPRTSFIQRTMYWWDYVAYCQTISQIKCAMQARFESDPAFTYEGISEDSPDEDIKAMHDRITAWETEWSLYGSIELETKIATYDQDMQVMIDSDNIQVKHWLWEDVCGLSHDNLKIDDWQDDLRPKEAGLFESYPNVVSRQLYVAQHHYDVAPADEKPKYAAEIEEATALLDKIDKDEVLQRSFVPTTDILVKHVLYNQQTNKIYDPNIPTQELTPVKNVLYIDDTTNANNAQYIWHQDIRTENGVVIDDFSHFDRIDDPTDSTTKKYYYNSLKVCFADQSGAQFEEACEILKKKPYWDDLQDDEKTLFNLDAGKGEEKYVALRANNITTKEPIPWAQLSDEKKGQYGNLEANYFYDTYKKMYDEQADAKQYLKDVVQPQIDGLEAELKRVQDLRTLMAANIRMSTYRHAETGEAFTPYELKVLNLLLRDAEYTNDNIFTTSINDAVDSVDKMEELYDDAIEQVRKFSRPQLTFKIDADNMLALPEFAEWHSQFELGNYIYVTYRDDSLIRIRMVGRTYNPCLPTGNLAITFSTITTTKTKITDVESVLGLAGATTSSGGSSSSGGGGGSGSWDEIYALLSSTMIQRLLSPEAFVREVKDVVANKVVKRSLTTKEQIYNSLLEGLATVDGSCLKAGVIRSEDENANGDPISWFNLDDGTFSYGNGGLMFYFDGIDNYGQPIARLRLQGEIEATAGNIDGIQIGDPYYSEGYADEWLRQLTNVLCIGQNGLMRQNQDSSYTKIESPTSENPKLQQWYERISEDESEATNDRNYFLSKDTEVNPKKTYYSYDPGYLTSVFTIGTDDGTGKGRIKMNRWTFFDKDYPDTGYQRGAGWSIDMSTSRWIVMTEDVFEMHFSQYPYLDHPEIQHLITLESATGSITATGAITGGAVQSTGAISGASVAASGNVSGNTVTATTSVTGATVEGTTEVKAKYANFSPTTRHTTTGDVAAKNYYGSGSHLTGVSHSNGSDYAEYFEWADGNISQAERRGRFVTLNGDKIRLAMSNDSYILGIITGTPTLLGHAAWDSWHDKYLRDEFGAIITKPVEYPAVLDDDGNVVEEAHTEYEPVINPDYDPTREYIPREQRPEWAPVGLVGQIIMLDDGTCEVNGFATSADEGIATKADGITNYRVIKRIDSNHIVVAAK